MVKFVAKRPFPVRKHPNMTSSSKTSKKGDFSAIIRKAKKLPKSKPKKKKMSIGLLQKKLWVECKRIIRQKYGNNCFTCGKTGLTGGDWHTGHFIPKGACGAFLKYDLRNLRPQCYHDNINLGGAGATYYRRLLETEGQEYVDQLFEDKNKVIKAYDHYEKLLEEYKSL